MPIEDEPISHKLSSIEPSSLQFQNFGENDFPAPPPHPQEMVDLEPAEYIRVPVKLGPDKTYREVGNFRTNFLIISKKQVFFSIYCRMTFCVEITIWWFTVDKQSDA